MNEAQWDAGKVQEERADKDHASLPLSSPSSTHTSWIQSVNLWRTTLADGLSRIKISSYVKSKGRSKLFVATKK
jgi:hypothetical protein